MALLELRGITKSYQPPEAEMVPVLKGIDLTISAGEFVAVMGQSGSGKSTLMNILGCLDSPTSGSYHLNGKAVDSLNDRELADIRNQTIGFVFQGFNLLRRMTALDNVALPLAYAGVGRSQARQRALEKLQITGLDHLAHRLPNQMSGGQQQRVAIARALVCNPPLLLADEPTGNLDSETSHDIIQSLTKLNQELQITIILVTHEPDVAQAAQRLVRLKDGLIFFDGPATDGLKSNF